ncbi:hypothetical protein [Pseudomonas phage vB_PseuGesM_254]|uniref:Uncharacterized protein n=1 Tax=Pseudomonas phage vB_PseuGesM_254 TaxID=3092638 RepID=A0AAX4G6N2_9CAUD|nr:hypothetical protein [Pseudomonas phage PseuGes_254]
MSKVENLVGIEGSFLESWNGWDDMGFAIQFYDPVFKADSGVPQDVIDRAYAGGSSTIVLDFEHSSMQIYDNEGETIYDVKIKAMIA